MTLAEAAKAGHARVRLPVWADPQDYLYLYIRDGQLGPWGRLYAPLQLRLPFLGRPQTALLFGTWAASKVDQWEPYTGPIAEDEQPW